MNFLQLSGIELSNKITSSLFVVNKQEGLLINRSDSKLQIDLSSLDFSKADIYFKKISGNGKVIINDKDIVINSRNEYIYSIYDKTINISKNSSSIGDILLTGIILFTEEQEESQVSKNWKSIIQKCGKYNGLRLVNNALHAVQGAYIERGYAISDIQTEPDNASYRDGDQIKFNIDCEIKSMETNHSFQDFKKNLDFAFMARKDYLPIINKDNDKIPEKTITADISTDPEKVKPTNMVKLDFVVHDTNLHGKFPENVSNKLVKYHISNGKHFLNIRKDGHYYLNIGELEPNSKYIVVLNGKKLSGNGKINIGFSKAIDTNPTKWFTGFLDNNMVDKHISLISDNLNYKTDGVKLHIALKEDAIGEVLINRILVVKDLNINNARVAGERFYPTEEPLILNNKNYSNFSVKYSSREAAKSNIFNYEYNYKIDAELVVEPINYSARKWVSHIYKTIANLTVIDKKNLVENSVYHGEPDLVLTRLGELKECKRIFIEEFDSKQIPSSNDVVALKGCDQIFTNSLQNKIVLSGLLSGKDIQIVTRPWPILNSYELTDRRAYLYIEKNEEFTKKIITYWQPNYPTLFIVGSTCGVPPYIKNISPYESYEKLQNYIINCKGLLDFNINNNYNSGILDICSVFKLNVITNNNKYIDEPTFSCIVDIDKYRFTDEVTDSITRSSSFKMDTQSYIKKYKENMNTLFGIKC